MVHFRSGLRRLALEQVLDLHGAGAQLLDVREPSDFAQGHLAGSVDIGLGGQYADVGRHGSRSPIGLS